MNTSPPPSIAGQQHNQPRTQSITEYIANNVLRILKVYRVTDGGEIATKQGTDPRIEETDFINAIFQDNDRWFGGERKSDFPVLTETELHQQIRRDSQVLRGMFMPDGQGEIIPGERFSSLSQAEKLQVVLAHRREQALVAEQFIEVGEYLR